MKRHLKLSLAVAVLKCVCRWELQEVRQGVLSVR